MGMVPKRLSPGVQHAEEANLGAQMFWIGGYLTQRLRGCPEQDVVDHGLVLEGDDLDLLGNREHHMEVAHIEQFRLAVLKPFGPRETLALRTIPITARIVSETLMAAIAAPLDVTAESGGAATLDRDHGAPPRGRQRRTVPVTESRAEVAEHIRHFQPLVGHATSPSGGHEVRHA